MQIPVSQQSPGTIMLGAVAKPWRVASAVAIILGLASVPLWVQNGYLLRIGVLIEIYLLLALGQQLITGYLGLLSLGHAGFYALGAYTSALVSLHFQLPWSLALLSAALVAGLAGFLLALPCLRVGGDYLTLMTIGFGEIVRVTATNWIGLTNGPMGLTGIPGPGLLGWTAANNRDFYWLYGAIALGAYFLCHRLVNSHLGRAFLAQQADEMASMSVGVPVTQYKVLGFAFGAAFAGVAGSMLAHFLHFVGPTNFTLDESLLHMQMVILGGLGSLPGTILGVGILVAAPEAFRVVQDYRMLLNGVLMVLLMIWRPQGLMGRVANTRRSGWAWLKERWSNQRSMRVGGSA